MNIKIEEMPTNPKVIRRYFKLRDNFVALTQLPDEAYITDDTHRYTNKFVNVMWAMFKAGYKAAAMSLKHRGHVDMNYYVIGRITSDGHIFADKPRRHASYGLALKEQHRLGDSHEGVKFGIFALVSTYRKESK